MNSSSTIDTICSDMKIKGTACVSVFWGSVGFFGTLIVGCITLLIVYTCIKRQRGRGTKVHPDQSDNTYSNADNTSESEVRKSLKNLKKVKNITVQVYDPRLNAKPVVDEVIKRLRRNFHDSTQFKEISFVYDVKPGYPLLICCVNTSRLETDADIAMLGITDLKSAILLVCHHVPEQLASKCSSRSLIASRFQQLAGIVDIAYWTGSGLYECPINRSAIGNISVPIYRIVSAQNKTVA
ncbi:hypothetical protein ACF0H5_002363 [Mactra antiquata]